MNRIMCSCETDPKKFFKSALEMKAAWAPGVVAYVQYNRAAEAKRLANLPLKGQQDLNLNGIDSFLDSTGASCLIEPEELRRPPSPGT
jgi:hypothetical protein